jgi:hypothetical protein
VKIRNLAFIEPHRYKPWFVRATKPHLLDREVQLLILITLPPGKARSGKARNKHKRVRSDRPADLRALVLTRP